MRKEISIAIKKPCSEKWDNFKPTAEGGFCNSCQKNVVDFTSMSDKELLEYFKHSTGKICGKLKANQLKLYSAGQTETKSGFYKFLKAGIISITLLMLSKPVVSTATSTKAPIYQAIIDTKKIVRSNDSNPQVISGKVVESGTTEGIPAVSVFLKGTSIAVNTDLDGYFTFPEPLKAGDVLVFSFIGMARKEYTVPKTEVKNLVIEMVMDILQLGQVSIEGAYFENAPKPSLWQRIASWF